MFSARVDEALYEYVREAAHQTRKSRQDILREALELFRAKYPSPVGSE
ncbi:ribbon-helix-helix protein, CopG family [Enterobacter hormaechei]